LYNDNKEIYLFSYWGASGLSDWTNSLLNLHVTTRICPSEHGYFYYCFADGTQLYLTFQPDDPTVAACLPKRHLLLDEGPQPSTKLCEDLATTGSAPLYLNSLFQTCVSARQRQLEMPSQIGIKSL